MNPKYISIFLCSFIFGVGLGSLILVAGSTFWHVIITLSFVCAISFLIYKNVGIVMLLIFIGSTFGYLYANKSFSGNEYENLIGQRLEVEGVVSADPVNNTGFNSKGQLLTLQPDGFHQYVRASLYTAIPDIKQGDRVWIRGQVELPNNFSGFDYVSFLQRYQIYAELKKSKVIVLHRASFSWRQPLLQIRDYIVNQTKVYPQKEGGLILGILIGQQQGITDDVKNAFKRTGLTHIVAVSGFNMTIIATAFGALVVYFGRRMVNILTIVVVIAFTVITGVTASVVRAAIMALLMVMAQLIGRRYESLQALLIVCVLMVLQNPRIVIWDIGFQLSVAATFGVLISFRIRKKGAPQTFWSDTLRPTLGAICVTAPIIAMQFKTFSVIAPVANIVVLPFVSWIMLFGALALLPVIGSVFVYPAQLLTSIIIFFTEKFSNVPYASISVNLPWWIWCSYYFVGFIYLQLAIKSTLPKLKKTDKL